VFFDFQVRNLLFDLRLELIRSSLELVHVLANLARDLRQLLGPEDDQGQQEQEDRLGKAHAIHHTAGKGNAAMREPAGHDLLGRP